MEHCARETAKNIREQINTFIDLKSDTKIFYIIQGNNCDDMIKWFDYGFEELEEHHWEHIQGLAFATTCIRKWYKFKFRDDSSIS